MNIQKLLCKKRQALRLHIEVLKSTDKGLQNRIIHRNIEAMSFTTAINARHHLKDRIALAERELQILEKSWKVV